MPAWQHRYASPSRWVELAGDPTDRSCEAEVLDMLGVLLAGVGGPVRRRCTHPGRLSTSSPRSSRIARAGLAPSRQLAGVIPVRRAISRSEMFVYSLSSRFASVLVAHR